MRLSVNIKPVQVSAPNKREIVDKIKRGKVHVSFSNYGTFLVNVSDRFDGTARVYNVEKRRKRVERSVVNGAKTSKVLNGHYWVGYYYDIPITLIKELGINVVQKNRHFVVVQK